MKYENDNYIKNKKCRTENTYVCFVSLKGGKNA